MPLPLFFSWNNNSILTIKSVDPDRLFSFTSKVEFTSQSKSI